MKVETDTHTIEQISSRVILQRASSEGEEIGRIDVNRITDKQTGEVRDEEVRFWFRGGKLTKVT